MSINAKFDLPTIYILNSHMKIAINDTSSASFSPSTSSIQKQIDKTGNFMSTLKISELAQLISIFDGSPPK